jgi:hypothetical protein
VAQRRPNPRLAKIHRNYTVEEVSRLYGIHRNTVRHWLKVGLQAVADSKRPTLILGADLAVFLRGRREGRRRRCDPGQIYCVRCREPRHPAGDMADYLPLTPTSGNLVGICPSCEALIYRRVNKAKLEDVCGQVKVTFTE